MVLDIHLELKKQFVINEDSPFGYEKTIHLL